LKGEAIANLIELYYMDEAGFAPTLPMGYTWAREGVRAIVPYEAPEGRRVNVIGALAPLGAHPRLAYVSRTTSFKGGDVLEFIWHDVGQMTTPVGEVPDGYKRSRPCAVVLDNYSPHHGGQIKEQLSALEAAGIWLFYLPPYSPELNLIEPMWRHIKHEDMPIRSYTTAEELKGAVDMALDKRIVALRVAIAPAVPSAILPAVAHAHTTVSLPEAA
jgi:putative transposase